MILSEPAAAATGVPVEGYVFVLLLALATLGYGAAVRFDLRGVGSRLAATHHRQVEHRKLYGQPPTLMSQLFLNHRVYGTLLLAAGLVLVAMDAFLFVVQG
ncbi:hypothetical protein [Kitasatospora sp. NPDC094015]|uniref:hypothetical protein n=1 Tax=Kitasatospora sp. NPDC094015 TaxID=3155205 RepID=UPI0033209772